MNLVDRRERIEGLSALLRARGEVERLGVNTPPQPPRRAPRIRAVAPVWPAAFAVVAALVVVHGAFRGTIRDTSYLVVTVGAAVLAFLGVGRHPEARRAPWLFVAIGVALSAVADVIWTLYLWLGGSGPDVSIADAFWIGSYIALFAGLVLLLGERHRDRHIDPDAFIDMAAIGSVALVAGWQISISDTVVDRSLPVTARVVLAAYPILDAVLLALVVRTIASYRGRAGTALVLAAGAASWLASDIGNMLFDASGTAMIVLDAGWMAGAALLAAAVWHRPLAEPQYEDVSAGVGPVRVALSLALLLLPSLIEVWGHTRGERVNPWPLLALAATLIGLTYVRSLRILHSASQARLLLQSREHYYRALAANSSDAVLLVDRDGYIVNEGLGLAALVGHAGTPTRGRHALSAVRPSDLADVHAMFDKVLSAPGTTFETELRTTRADGSEIWLAARAVNLIDDPDVAGVVVTLHEITDRKRVEHELAHQAFHDVLTGLANRALFRDRIEHALSRTRRTDLVPAVVFMDLDGFKTVNDSLGHDAGDQVLREVAHRLASAIRSGDTVARLGGDEFAILIEESHRPVEEAEGVAERILSALAEPVHVRDQQIQLSASLGVAVGDEEASAGSLLRNADVAMYRAKAAGKGRWVVFDPEMRAAAIERLRFETDLVGALEAGQFRLVYQPVIELETERIVGFEALLRWDHPTLGELPPEKFIPVVEDNGLIVPIGSWVLREACRAAAQWERAYASADTLTIAINLSARQLASRDLVKEVAYALEESGLDPSRLVLEITETVLVADTALAARRLRELHELGVRLAIDDFGTGYSSLSYLREFPVDILKIDKSFIDGITDVKKVPAIVRGLLDLGRTLHLETVAEGVEQPVQRDQLRAEHCNFAQGFLFAKPLDPEEVELLLMQRAGKPAPPTTTQG